MANERKSKREAEMSMVHVALLLNDVDLVTYSEDAVTHRILETIASYEYLSEYERHLVGETSVSTAMKRRRHLMTAIIGAMH